MRPASVGGGVTPATREIRVVRLTLPVRLAVPSLFLSSIPRRAIGFSFEAGLAGGLTGSCLLGGSILLGWLTYPLIGPLGALVAIWLVGSTGVVMICGSMRGLAFIKPLCRGCRLFPIIEEHEAMHIAGMESDDAIWATVKGRYGYDELHLGTDPKICSFCPVARRLKTT
jgi:hypothetical protein